MRGGVNSTHLNTAETSPVTAPVQGSSPKYVSELRSRTPRTKRPRGAILSEWVGPQGLEWTGPDHCTW